MPVNYKTFFNFLAIAVAFGAAVSLSTPAIAQSAPERHIYNYTCSWEGQPFGASVGIANYIYHFPQLLPYTDGAGSPHNVEFMLPRSGLLVVFSAEDPTDRGTGAPGSMITLSDGVTVCTASLIE